MDEALTIEVYCPNNTQNPKLTIKIDPDNELFYIYLDNKKICYGHLPALLRLFKRALEIWKLEE